MNISRSSGALIKRVPTTIDLRRDITTYSLDNLYPQRVEQIMYRSPIAISAVEAKADFLNGEGFEANGDVIVNAERELTTNDILAAVAQDYALYNGFALHCNFDLTGAISSITPIEFKYVRFGLPDQWGRYSDVKVNTNWEDDYGKGRLTKDNILTYPLLNANNLAEEVKKFGSMEEHPGQVFLWTPKPNQYPLSSLDSVLDSAQTNGEIQVFELGSIQNGFLGTSLFKYPGEFENDRERQEFLLKIQAQQGAENANSIVVVEVPDGFENDILESLPANNNDRLFELTNLNTVKRIMQRFGMPPSILGVMPESGMFNQEQIKDSYIYYNTRTENDRAKILRAFNRLGADWTGGPLDFVNITPQAFIEEESTESVEPAPKPNPDE